MKRLLIALALVLLPSFAWAQCNGVFPNATVCGNSSGASNTPRAINPASLLGAAGGTNGQIQYNSSGALGGFTMSGACTTNTTTGVITCTDTIPLSRGGLGASQVGATANQIPVYPGSSGPAVPTSLIPLLNTICTLSPTTCASFFGYGNVLWWGAVCNNSTDDRLAIIAAIAATPSGGTLVFPSTVCAVKSLTAGATNPRIFALTSPIHLSFANGGGIFKSTVIGILFDIESNGIIIDGSPNAILDGGWAATTYTAFDIAIGSNDYDTVSTTRSGIKISGIQIQNWAHGGVFVWYLNNSTINNLNINNIAYAGIYCGACSNSKAVENLVSNIWSSTGPDQPGNPVYRANHYGISFSTNLAVTSVPLNDLVIGNIVNNVPAWECYDTHGAQGITFANNIGLNCGIGISANSPTPADILNVNISNNQIACIPLGSPVYSGSSGVSVGGQGVSVVGLSSSNFGAPININGNTTNLCGPDNLTLEGDSGAYFVALLAGMNFTGNIAYNSRYASFAFGDFVIGNIFNNISEGLVAGPVGGTPTVFNLLGSHFQINMGNNTGFGTGYNGYNLAGQITGFTVTISRSNFFQGVGTLHIGTGTYTDLGTTAP